MLNSGSRASGARASTYGIAHMYGTAYTIAISIAHLSLNNNNLGVKLVFTNSVDSAAESGIPGTANSVHNNRRRHMFVLQESAVVCLCKLHDCTHPVRFVYWLLYIS